MTMRVLMMRVNGGVLYEFFLFYPKDRRGDASDCKTLASSCLWPVLPKSLHTAIDTYRPDLYSSPLGDSTPFCVQPVQQCGSMDSFKRQHCRHRRGRRHAPVGTVKTRLQVQGASASSLTRYGGVAQGLTRILTKEGVGALYKGVGVVVATAAPAQGLFFLGNDTARSSLRPHLPAAAASFAAGCVAQLCGSLCWVPMDTVKERLQVEGQLKRGSKAELGGSWNAVRTILRREGLRDSIPAYWVHQATWAPFNGLFFAIYEACKDAGVHGLGSGVVAGVAAGFLTNPMDLVKTRLQVARTSPETFAYAGAFDCIGQILRREGPLAFLDGAIARCATVAPRVDDLRPREGRDRAGRQGGARLVRVASMASGLSRNAA